MASDNGIHTIKGAYCHEDMRVSYLSARDMKLKCMSTQQLAFLAVATISFHLALRFVWRRKCLELSQHYFIFVVLLLNFFSQLTCHCFLSIVLMLSNIGISFDNAPTKIYLSYLRPRFVMFLYSSLSYVAF
uniref:G protein-coupled receptor n=1 Tax=Ascaris lumbricoides TaxID=6252 RepID=A0A0M3I3M6_ASCLU